MMVKELWFTHYSPSIKDPLEYETVIRQIFPQAIIPADGQKKVLRFVDEGE
jgi:ribonuclease Z